MESEKEREELRRSKRKGRIRRGEEKKEPWQSTGLNQRKGEQETQVGSWRNQCHLEHNPRS